MTLRELVQQAGGINSPAMDYELIKPNDEISSDIDSIELDDSRKEIILT